MDKERIDWAQAAPQVREKLPVWLKQLVDPHNVSRDLTGLYFVGQGAYPGIGMPMVLISARLVAERLGWA